MPYELQVLGGVALSDASGDDAGVPRGKPMAMVSYLAMNPDGAERDHLARLLWSGGDASKGRHSVRQALSRVRQALGSEAFIGSDPIQLAPGLVSVDLETLRSVVKRGEIDRALTLWGGEPFAGLSISEEPGWTSWVSQVREETHALLAAGLEEAAAGALGQGSREDAIQYLGKATEVLPRRAEAWARLVEVQTDLGRLRDARTTLAAAWAALDADTYEARLGDLERRVSLGGDPSTAQSENDVLGREADLAAVAEAWRGSLEGRTSVIVFQAPRGGGKTRMIREAEGPLVTPGAHVIHIDCRREGGTGEPWQTVREIVRGLSGLPGADDAMVGSRDRLSQLTELSMAELVDAFLDLFTSVCRSTPVLLTLDEVEWIDPDSWGLLKRLIRLRPASAILIVASLTPERGRESGPADDIAAWWDQGWVTVRSLRPFSAAEVEAAVRMRGWREDGFVRSLRDVLHLRSQGSPAAVFGLLDSLAMAGVRPPPPGSPTSPVPELPHLDELPFSDGLLQFHRGRLADLESTAHEMLSLLGQMDMARLETLAHAANSDPETVRRALSELVDAAFVVSSGDGYRLAHPDYAKLGSEWRPTPSAPEPTSRGGDHGEIRSTPTLESDALGPSPALTGSVPVPEPEPSMPSTPSAPSEPSMPSTPSAPSESSTTPEPEGPSPWGLEEPLTPAPPSKPSSPWGPAVAPSSLPPTPSEPRGPSPWGPEEPLTPPPPSAPSSPWGPEEPLSPASPPLPWRPEDPSPSIPGGPSTPAFTDTLGHSEDSDESASEDGGLSATTADSRAPIVRSPVSGSLDFDDELPPPPRSIFPPGWRPQPPAYIAAALLIGFIWIVWSVFTRR